MVRVMLSAFQMAFYGGSRTFQVLFVLDAEPDHNGQPDCRKNKIVAAVAEISVGQAEEQA